MWGKCGVNKGLWGQRKYLIGIEVLDEWDGVENIGSRIGFKEVRGGFPSFSWLSNFANISWFSLEEDIKREFES